MYHARKKSSTVVLRTARLVVVMFLLSTCSSAKHGGEKDASATDVDADTDIDADIDADVDTDTDTGTSTSCWHWENLPAEINWGMLLDIAGSISDDIVSVGTVLLPYGQVRQALRFDGETWIVEPHDFDALFLDIACVSEDGTYYVGTLVKNPEFSVYANDGDSWLAVAAPDQFSCGGFWFPGNIEVAGYMSCSAPSGFAILYACGSPGPVSEPYYLSAFDGAVWTSVLGPDSLPEAEANIHLVRGATANDLSLFASHDVSAPGYHFDGEALTPMTAPPWPECEGPYGCVNNMDGDAEHGYGYYAVGAGVPEGGPELQGFVWHSENEVNWFDVPVPHPSDPETYYERFDDVWISDQGEVYVVGERYFYDDYPNGHPFPVLLRFDGEEWEEIDVPPHPESDDGQAELHGVWGSGPEVFAVGSYVLWGGYNPAILHYGPE